MRLVAAWTKNHLHENPVARDNDKTIEIADVTTRYNAAPMQWLPVIRRRPEGEGVLYAFRWGLLPSWAKDGTIAARLINARAETLADKPAFRSALRKRRCIVPTDGFYEWVRRPDGRQPIYIHTSDSTLSSFAGLWEGWTRPGGGAIIDRLLIVPTAVNDRVRALRDRMPVILAPEAVARWPDPASAPDSLKGMLGLCPAARLELHPVTRVVGNVLNEGPELIAAISEAGTRTSWRGTVRRRDGGHAKRERRLICETTARPSKQEQGHGQQHLVLADHRRGIRARHPQDPRQAPRLRNREGCLSGCPRSLGR